MVLVVLIFLVLHSEQVSAGTQLSDLALFRRCYSQLTGLPVPLNHASYVGIKNKSLTGLAECSKLIDQVVIDPQTGLLRHSNKDSLAILNQMHALHRTWFSSNSVEQIQGYAPEIGQGTVDVYDATEPSLAITRAVFTDQAKYSDVLTLSTGVQALREDNPEIVKRQNFVVKNPGRINRTDTSFGEVTQIEFRSTSQSGVLTDNKVYSDIKPVPYIQAGDLKGVQKRTSSFIVPNFSFQPLNGNLLTDSAHLIPDLNWSFDLYKNLGGGVLGTPIYLMMNYGRELGTPSNGSTKVPRRWAQTNLNTFLCLSLPTLRESDIQHLIKSSSPTPFRNATSCVSCHATLDQMAYTARNVVIGASNYIILNTPTPATVTLLMSTFKQTHPSVAGWPDTEISDFHKQTPSGKLFFRSASGELINQTVNSIQELGQALVDTDDYYLCAAKRYYEFFTGQDISLYDRTNPANTGVNKLLTAKDIENRAFIESLAQKLKKDQSVKELIKNIMHSEEYIQKDFGL